MKNTAEKDFKKAMLPSNRKELFLDVVKNNYRKLLFVGAMLLLFSLPLMFVYVYKEASYTAIYEEFINEKLTTEDFNLYSKANTLKCNLLITLFLMIFSIGVSGVMQIIKRLCYLEPIFLWHDFKVGIKNNFKSMLVLFAMFGLINTMFFYILDSVDSPLVIGITISLIFLIIYPIMLLVMTNISVYTQNIFKRFFKIFQITVFNYVPILLMGLIAMTPLLILLIPNLPIMLLILSLVITFLSPILGVLYFDFSLFIFDKCINKYNFPELVGKGITH